MKLSELHKVNVSIIEAKLHYPVVLVKCDVCGHEWQMLMTAKGTIRRGEWKCQMCHPPKSWFKFAKDMEEEMRLCDEREKGVGK
jgi:hypothetical protein